MDNRSLASLSDRLFGQILDSIVAIVGFLIAGTLAAKRLLNTAVIDATTGQPCTYGKAFIRNLLLAVLGLIDWVFIFGEKRQRLGDKAANTIVIKTQPATY